MLLEVKRSVYCNEFVDPAIIGGSKEGNVLFNDALNTFYFTLYGIRHMVKNH